MLALAILAAAPAGDSQVIAGKRVGSIDAKSSEAELKKAFGATAVRTEDSGWAGADEGSSGKATAVFPESPDRLLIVWTDAAKRTQPRLIVIGDKANKKTTASRWKTPEGIGLGTSLEEVEKINGAPFFLEPLGSDLGGNAFFEKGKLSAGHAPIINFEPEVKPEKLSEKDQATLNALKDWKSDDPTVRLLKLHVASMVVELK
ncbi:MAG: hypothetical protein JST54_00600 [Deltaproteobacteria bacterium]|nr:hypothetical protein [Deltaproteobacteria bacterium]